MLFERRDDCMDAGGRATRRAGRFRHPASGGTCASLHGGCPSAVSGRFRHPEPLASLSRNTCASMHVAGMRKNRQEQLPRHPVQLRIKKKAPRVRGFGLRFSYTHATCF